MVLAALGILVVRKAVHAALLLAVVMIGLAVLYLVQDAPFLFAVQIIVYTGAILMLFLFVVMLVGVDASDSLVETIRGQRLMARSEEHTSELQSRQYLVCRLLLEKKKIFLLSVVIQSIFSVRYNTHPTSRLPQMSTPFSSFVHTPSTPPLTPLYTTCFTLTSYISS